eukprot:COSAG01_NODE_20944_length_926_cov_1.860943_1_plen_92_part_00
MLAAPPLMEWFRATAVEGVNGFARTVPAVRRRRRRRDLGMRFSGGASLWAAASDIIAERRRWGGREEEGGGRLREPPLSLVSSLHAAPQGY